MLDGRNLTQTHLYEPRHYEPLSLKNKRNYHRIKSGEYLARLRRQTLRMVTLTTSDYAKNDNDFSTDIDTFFKRWRRKDPNLDYWKINVKKNGRWHCHIVYKGSYVTHGWLKYNWGAIHNSYIVHICCLNTNRSIANYVANQYLSSQDGEYTRMSYSQGWLFKGAVSIWKQICSKCRDYTKGVYKYGLFFYPVKMKYALNLWNDFLYRTVFLTGDFLTSICYHQTLLTDYG